MARHLVNFDADAALALEQRWDARLGGAETRAHRELLAYCLGRVLAAGGDPSDVAEYFADVLELLAKAPAAELDT